MKIGFYIKWDKFSLSSSRNVVGDELWGESLCKAINKQYKDIKAELYAPNYLPKNKLDLMIYLNDTRPNENFASRHILYLQNGYGDKAERLIEKMVKNNYDGYVFFSNRLKEIFDKKYETKESLYLPFGVDTEIFSPQKYNSSYDFDCSYIGNDIKGEDATMKYLYPAKDFDFGLFGNWKPSLHRRKFWKNFERKAPYEKLFNKLSKGRVPQEEVPTLYSSSKINLNFTLQSCIDWDVITLRTYEVLACKGFLITDIFPSAKATMSECMVFTAGNDDLKEKIIYYLDNEKERNKIAQNGYEYVVKFASIDSRASKLINYIKKEL